MTVEQDRRLLLRARLGPLSQAHPAALLALLEALSLWQTSRLIAVVGVDGRAGGWPSMDCRLATARVRLEPCLLSPSGSLRDLRTLADELGDAVAVEASHAR